MNIVQHVNDFLHRNLSNSTKFIVAVSGGKDSIALLHLLKQLGVDVVAAHCNFKLRADESDEDEQFVKSFCKLHDIKLECISFDTKTISLNQKTAIQETARALRYNWFEELRVSLNADYILTAHHANDLAETFLFNAARGSGINGLKSIPAINGFIARPLLHITQEQITNYVVNKQLQFRVDSSNLSDKYSRNFIRHQIIPLLEQINPQAVEHIMQSTQVISSLLPIVEEKFDALKKQLITIDNGSININLIELQKLNYASHFLFNELSVLGFNNTQVLDMLNTSHQSGSSWNSHSHIAIINQAKLIVYPGTETAFEHEEFLVNEIKETTLVTLKNQTLKLLLIKAEEASFSEHELYLDIDKITWPITFRNWQMGDKFSPLGLKGRKKISDYFIDKKTPDLLKQKSIVITDSKDIIGLFPFTIDNQVKITPTSKHILKITMA
jgi:tRNA(Ile)-lysidine synthase